MKTELFDDPAEVGVCGYALVAIERGIDLPDGGLTYAVPEAMGDLAVGQRVKVPLGRGNKLASGYVVGLLKEKDAAIKRVKPIAHREPEASSLPGDLVELAKWIAGYYCCPLGMVFGSMLPAAVKHATGSTTRLQVRRPLKVDGDDATDGEAQAADVKLTKLQRVVLETASAEGEWVDAKALADDAGAKSLSSVKQLIDKGVLEARHQETVVSDLDLRAQQVVKPGGSVDLTPAQQYAVDQLGRSLDAGFNVQLIHGVTGSGKTEVYLRAIEAMFSRDGRNETAASRGVSPPAQVDRGTVSDSASELPGPGRAGSRGSQASACIVLVPEIALTPQTVGRFLARFGGVDVAGGGGVAVLHSGLTASQRHAQWRRIRRGEARIVVGARSAIFAPLPNVGLIIVDEEHESSYKQDQLPRYHARDVAIKRAQLAGCPIILGSATPSLESAYNAGLGAPPIQSPPDDATTGSPNQKSSSKNQKYNLISLPDRVPGAHLPKVEIIDLQEERRQRKGIHLMSSRLETLIDHNLAATGQTILLLNRRGYANYISCPDHRCGWTMQCEHCDVTMVYHRDRALPTGGYVRCHHCQAEQRLPQVCPDSGHKVNVFGLGTQRVEEEIRSKFPNARLARMDADVMRSAKDYQRTLDAFAAGETDILLGTQMIAKGLDVPNVRLVGVISADTALHLPDFRASERTFQLIAQVAGRAGRGEHLGRVVVQTYTADDPTIELAANHDFVTFATREIEQRAAVGLPPLGRMARIVLRDTDKVANTRRAAQLAHALREANQQLGSPVRLRGPSACPIERIADHHRQHIELLCPTPAPLQKLLTHLRNTFHLTSDTHTAIDVDPVAMM